MAGLKSKTKGKSWERDVANFLTNKVSLEEPDWEIILQILGEQTGISVMPKNSILSISKIKRLD